MALPNRHPEHDEWKAQSIRLAAELRELKAETAMLREILQFLAGVLTPIMPETAKAIRNSLDKKKSIGVLANLLNQRARRRLEITAIDLGGYGTENIDQFLRGDFSSASPEDVEHLRNALQGI